MKDLRNPIINKISQLLELARTRVMVTVNQTMVLTYFEIGRMIVEEEQNGENRAEYGKALLKNISKELTRRFGRGFSLRDIEQMRQFYLSYSISQTPSSESDILELKKTQTLSAKFDNKENEISQTLSGEFQNIENHQYKLRILSEKFKLSWSHYLKLMRITDVNERNFYEIESYKNN